MNWRHQVDWRFLTFPDGEPGFSTAWLRTRSLEKQVEIREREYQNGVMARLAEEFGVTGLFASAHQKDVSDGGATFHEEHNKEKRGGNEWDEVVHTQHVAKVVLNELGGPPCRAVSTTSTQQVYLTCWI